MVQEESEVRAPERDGSEPEAAEPEQSALVLQARLLEEEEKARTYYSNWQRAVADYQNLKRRTEEERGERQREASRAWVLKLLGITDDLDLALQSGENQHASEAWLSGIRQIQRKAESELQASGVQEVAAADEEFDPNHHEAIGHANGAENRVVTVVRKGYTMGDRLIRPAMVLVGNGTEEQ